MLGFILTRPFCYETARNNTPKGDQAKPDRQILRVIHPGKKSLCLYASGFSVTETEGVFSGFSKLMDWTATLMVGTDKPVMFSMVALTFF